MRLALLAALLPLAALASAQSDKKGAADHPVISRMPGYALTDYEVKDFDVFESPYLSGADAKWEGRLYKLGYTRKEGAKPVGMLQIERNNEAALAKAGAKILYRDDRIVAAAVRKGGAATFVESESFNDGRNYELTIVEKGAMAQEVTADASALRDAIAASGKAAVYGIYFDTGKATIKPESDPTLDQIAKLLKDNPSLKLFVVGHTDSDGALEPNLKLSADRAAAAVAALVGRGIGAARLKSAGVGPYAPEASNRTDAGKAKNRRVELVERF